MSDLIDFLKTRSSTPIVGLIEPAPSADELAQILTIASRVPDHGKLNPWRFIIYRDDARIQIGEMLAERAAQRAQQQNEEFNDSHREKELKRFSRAPLVIGIICSPRDTDRIPEWEQFLSSGAAAMQLCNAANALGYGSNWITNWYSDDEEGKRLLGVAPYEKVAGFVHLGTPKASVPDRPRPDLQAIVSDYSGPYQG
ncbi:nitroreductase [Pseudochrobactrum algeriensis]|uniref:nitroreductase family protein n=1 Tax=Pseudochrobactrum algeriensis TaxID=2834768 RepID=UPI001BCAC91A|nr:nitroreductase [Pseudochrobactrum algeriensis]MBX8811236.1 nitroreductase [Ochrobactrum sp. MR34]QVQ38146.1 nitroreductase [Pseudochrobactrum algeriensis]QVQ41372.1 nitroreductase [Pseudochrobactrum algeriensis]QVQ45294.1 nitroreductase [Pseudochrobactrum algeriensis]